MSLPVQEIIEWDVPNWSRLIKYWTPFIDKLPRDSKVLAIGERNGGLSAWMALLGFNVVCSDREMPLGAKQLHSRLGVSGKITYETLDIVNCDWPREQFDIILAKSVIGGLKADPGDRRTRNFEVQQKAVANIYGLLKQNGYFFSAENMVGNKLLQFFRRRQGKDKGWRYFKKREVKEMYGSFSDIYVQTFGLIPTSFRSIILNYYSFTINRMLNFLPDKYKYIAFIIASKKVT